MAIFASPATHPSHHRRALSSTSGETLPTWGSSCWCPYTPSETPSRRPSATLLRLVGRVSSPCTRPWRPTAGDSRGPSPLPAGMPRQEQHRTGALPGLSGGVQIRPWMCVRTDQACAAGQPTAPERPRAAQLVDPGQACPATGGAQEPRTPYSLNPLPPDQARNPNR